MGPVVFSASVKLMLRADKFGIHFRQNEATKVVQVTLNFKFQYHTFISKINEYLKIK